MRAAAAAPTVRCQHAERIEAAAAEVLSANTHRAYATAWRARLAWCTSERIEPLPAQPVLVAAYLAERAETGAGILTLRTAVAAIAHEHASRGAPSPAIHPGVRRVLRGLTRREAWAGHTPRQAAALTAEALAAIRLTAHHPRTGPGGRIESAEQARRRGDMDVAILTVMNDALLRRSEAAALTWADAERQPDGTGRLTVHRGKVTRRARAPSSLSAATRSRRWSAFARRLPPQRARCSADLVAAPSRTASARRPVPPVSRATTRDTRRVSAWR